MSKKVNPFYVDFETRFVKHEFFIQSASVDSFCTHHVIIDSRKRLFPDFLTDWVINNLSGTWYFKSKEMYDSKIDEDYELWIFKFEEETDAVMFKLRWG